MNPLTLDDLSREELLALIKDKMPLRARQADLLSIRHGTLSQKAAALDAKWAAAEAAHGRALAAWCRCKGSDREKNALDRIWIDLRDAAKRARWTAARARREEEECWKALQAEWDRGRA